MQLRFSQLILILFVASTVEFASAEPVDFVRDVQPILVKHCIVCHGPGKQESGYRIDLFESLIRGGESETVAVVTADIGQSHLIARVTSNDPLVKMPPKGTGLENKEIETLKAWIRDGAKGPSHIITNANTEHWSFQSIHSPPLPPTTSSNADDNAVDAFIHAKLHELGLDHSVKTDRNTLIRRLYLVMLGLTPTPQEVREFVDDQNDDAYSRLVERVLASPHYGERWAQHWLDCVRYAESTGYEINRRITNIYPYRDYVIQAFNDDKPYDQFIREQIAGDFYKQDAATGFLVAGPHDTNPSPDPRLTAMQYQDGHDEIIKTVSAVTMGLTIGCARCHDHKFDPISQEDYYRFQAAFAGISYGTRRQQGKENDRMLNEAKSLEVQLTSLREKAAQLRDRHQLFEPIDLREYDEEFPSVLTDTIQFKINATNDGNAPELDDIEIWAKTANDAPSINVAHRDRGATATSSVTAKGNQGKSADLLLDGSRQLLLYFKAGTTTDVWIQIHLDKPYSIDRITIKPRGRAVPVDYEIQVKTNDEQWRTIINSKTRYPHLTDTRSADAMKLSGLTPEAIATIVDNTSQLRKLTQTYERLKAGPQIYVGKIQAPRVTHLMIGGDPQKPGKVVEPGFLSVLEPRQPDITNTEQARRLSLAEQIASSNNPLTARVITNRIWQHIFGTGIVDTPSDFGINGSLPTHPELLDYLASYLIRKDWSLKELHRLILHSATFQQSSESNTAAHALDSSNRLLWRFPPQRLEGEAIRDSILRASGKLNPKQFGPPFQFFEKETSPFSKKVPLTEFTEEGWRRMIYGEKIRLESVGIFGAFDCPDSSQMTPKRTVSTSAIQALSLFNSHFVSRHGQFMADEAQATHPNDVVDQVNLLFLRTLARKPSKPELEAVLPLVKSQGLASLGRVLFNLNEFVFIN